MTKVFSINYNGKPEQITVNDKPTAGVVFKIGESTIKWKAGQGMPDINFKEYIYGVACNLITSAPWGTTTPDIINNLDIDTFEELTIGLCDVLPLERFLSLGGKAMYGKKLEITPYRSATESITSSPNGESVSVK